MELKRDWIHVRDAEAKLPLARYIDGRGLSATRHEEIRET